MRRLHLLRAAALILLPCAALAQTPEADRSYLQGLLEDNLSGAGRQVTITGFEGALSSQASISRLTIADDQGIWLTLTDVALDWNRSALLAGALSVNTLTAGEIVLDRLPATQTTPAPEAREFSLPQLPVSVDIGSLKANRVVLGPAVLGQSLEVEVEAALTLAEGSGSAKALVQRIDDGPQGKLSLEASFNAPSKLLQVDLALTEATGGIVSSKLNLPGVPSIALTVKGAGPLSAFLADITLATDDTTRLAGQVALTGQDSGATRFSANLAGDVVPLFLPDYASFFGPDVRLALTGERWPDGRTDLSALSITTQAMRFGGSLTLGSDGVPQRFDLTALLGMEDGSPVTLPLTTTLPVQLKTANLVLGYDASKGEGWTLVSKVQGLDLGLATISDLSLNGSGRIGRMGGDPRFGATVSYAAKGINPVDRALAAALGPQLTGQAVAYWTGGDGAISIPKLSLSGEDYSVQLGGKIGNLASAFNLSGRASARMTSLSRLSALAGRPLAGSASLALSGNGSPLTGAFDIEASAEGTDMAAGIAPLDRLLKGRASVETSIRRDSTGTALRDLTITAATLSARAKGMIATAGSDVTADLEFTDLSVLGSGYRGALAGNAHATGTLSAGAVDLTATGTDLAVGQEYADKVLRGNSAILAKFALRDGKLQVENATLTNPQLSAKANGVLDGSEQRVSLEARLANLGLLVPEFPGPLTLSGTAVQDQAGTQLDLQGQGPGQINGKISGRLTPGFKSGDLSLRGTAIAALANGFIAPRAVSGAVGIDLRLNGPLALSSLSGTANLNDGRLADPDLPFALQAISARANLANGRAEVVVDGSISTGGTVAMTGNVGLISPFDSDLTVQISGANLRDPELYQTRANGNLTISGPLAGGAQIAGRIALGLTELRVPASGFAASGVLEDLKHVNEPAAVRITRERAGLVAKPGSTLSKTAAFGLDVVISAPNQVFVRGRGLDAELGGEVRLRGTTVAVSPEGAFSLIRGRLDILGKRLDLTEATLQMEGELIPYLHVVASTTTDTAAVSVEIDGPATQPVVRFTSVPSLPEEEVLAQLLFGQTLQGISALQAVQLASAVATLAGKGGGGLINNLRKGAGLDNLDVSTASDGTAAVSAGKYLTKKIYTEVQVDQSGKSQIDLNLDVTKSITLRGSSNSDGTNSLGIYLEKDY